MILVPAELKSALRSNEISMSVLLLSANQSSPLPEDLVPVPLHATEYRDVVLGLDVPQPHRVILVKILIMIIFFVNVICYKFLGSSIAYL